MPESEVRFGGGPFEDAIAHFQRKVRVPVTTYRDLPAQMHAKAFMVAGAAMTPAGGFQQMPVAGHETGHHACGLPGRL